ncbi:MULTISPECIES: HU family DNA-binding protein [Blastopirellula]|uniref:Probable DNA-binding protein HU n=1 Tax=Blastopirellula marina DSM 3645 TaxID=314230 RepID=A4A0S4_9BACT|nr:MULTISPECIES: HU family DNA-binding protein [Blastopirellula]EAQ77638.1 probable DNA-binding protein HU [Blastopirellula marina DSM 3645]UUO08979.1 HU family DNA-binding protein [Blastopirellula sp. J2-11]
MAKKAVAATTVKKPLTKTELLNNIAEETGIAKKDVSIVLDSLQNQVKKSLGKTGAGAISLPGLIKIEKKKVPARPAKKGVPNPFKPGELMDVPAKPASVKVKIRALKNLKDMV